MASARLAMVPPRRSQRLAQVCPGSFALYLSPPVESPLRLAEGRERARSSVAEGLRERQVHIRVRVRCQERTWLTIESFPHDKFAGSGPTLQRNSSSSAS